MDIYTLLREKERQGPGDFSSLERHWQQMKVQLVTPPAPPVVSQLMLYLTVGGMLLLCTILPFVSPKKRDTTKQVLPVQKIERIIDSVQLPLKDTVAQPAVKKAMNRPGKKAADRVKPTAPATHIRPGIPRSKGTRPAGSIQVPPGKTGIRRRS